VLASVPDADAADVDRYREPVLSAQALELGLRGGHGGFTNHEVRLRLHA
jgi:hypothetical protein